MTDQPNDMTADDLLAYLGERSKQLGQLVHRSPPTENETDPKFSVFRKSAEPFSVPKPLNENDKVAFFPFFRSGRKDTCAHTRDARTPAHMHTRIFNSIYYGKTEKEKENPRETAYLGVSVGASQNGKFSEKTEKPPVCCICKQPIDTPVDTLWGADPAHRPCAEAAFQANKAAGRYKP